MAHDLFARVLCVFNVCNEMSSHDVYPSLFSHIPQTTHETQQTQFKIIFCLKKNGNRG